MSGWTEAARHAFITYSMRGGAAPADAIVTEWALVTAVSAGMLSGGAIANEITLTGYSRPAVGSTIDAPASGVSDNQLISFGTATAGQGTQTATHMIGVTAGGNCAIIIQLTNSARTAPESLAIDTTTNNRVIRVPAAAAQISFTAVADLT